MIESPAVFRSALASALRSLPSELGRAPVPRSRAARRAVAGVRELAADLERVSPGLALMLQLRARLFEQAARAARARGFEQVVTVGWGFTRRLPRGRAPLLVTVEDRLVLEADADATPRAPRIVRVAANDLGSDAWAALSTRVRCADRKTLFLVEGVSVWGGEAALSCWLSRVAEMGAAGSEIVVNVLDAETVAAARASSGADWSPVHFGLDRGRLASEITARGLTLLRLFDSREVERVYLGVASLFVGELYGWARVATPGSMELAGRGPATRRPERTRARAALPLRELLRGALASAMDAAAAPPALVPGLELRDDGGTVAHLVRPVTALRACVATLRRPEVAALRLFDGSVATPGPAVRPTRDGPPAAAAAAPELAHALRAHGFLALAGESSDGLARLRERAFAALEEDDPVSARHVSGMLTPFVENPAVAHLRSLLRRVRHVAFARDAEVAVVASAKTARAWVRELARAARALLRAITRVLGVRFTDHVLVDVSSARPALPIAVVGVADPHTVVSVPLPSYSRPLLCHELTHVVAMASSSWLSEGLAVWMQRLIAPGACFPDDVATEESGVDRAPLAARLFDDVTGSARSRIDPGAIRVSYRQAAAFVAWVISRFGMRRFVAFFAALRFRDDADVAAACRVLGVASFDDLDRVWRRRS